MSSDELVEQLLAPDEPEYGRSTELDETALAILAAVASEEWNYPLALKAVTFSSLVDSEGAIETLKFAATAGRYHRATAAASVVHLADAQAVPILTELIVDADEGVRKTAIDAAGLVGSPKLTDALKYVRDFDPRPRLRKKASAALDRLKSATVGKFQAQVDDITRRAKRRPHARSLSDSKLSAADVDFLDRLYDGIELGGFFAGYPEASQLIRRYRRPSMTGIESINSGIYENSKVVKKEVERHKKLIRQAAIKGKIPLASNDKKSYSVNGAARTSETCRSRPTSPRPDHLLVADDERLMKANNRFYLQSYSTREVESATVATEFVVTDCYAFETFATGKYTELPALGTKLKIEDGLSEYLTRIGMADVFTYESTWQIRWNLD